MGSVMMTACLPRSFSSDFAIKAPDCFSSVFSSRLSLSPSVSLHHNLLSIPFPPLHLSLFYLAYLFVSLYLCIYIFSPSFFLPYISLVSFSMRIQFVKIYRSPVDLSHSHACSVSRSHLSVHKTRSLWPDIKEKGGKEKRDRFSSVP